MIEKKEKIILNPSFSFDFNTQVRKKNQPVEKRAGQLSPDSRGYFQILSQLAKVKSGQKLPPFLLPHIDFLMEHGIAIEESTKPDQVDSVPRVTLKHLKMVPNIFRESAQLHIKKYKLKFNKDFVFIQNQYQRPRSVLKGLPPENEYPGKKNLVWVYDPGTKIWAYYNMAPTILKSINALSRGHLEVHNLSAETIELLFHAEILVINNFKQKKISSWNKKIKKYKSELKKNRFTVLRQILSPLQISVLRKHYRDLEAGGYLELDREQVKFKRFCYHNEDYLTYIHRQSGSLARTITGSPILPSYSFLSAYLEGAELEKHTDRPQCAWNGSLLIDQAPETSIDESWPMYLQVGKKTHKVQLDFGDVVFYSGTEIPHWRESIAESRRQTLGLLHYVPIDFIGNLY